MKKLSFFHTPFLFPYIAKNCFVIESAYGLKICTLPGAATDV